MKFFWNYLWIWNKLCLQILPKKEKRRGDKAKCLICRDTDIDEEEESKWGCLVKQTGLHQGKNKRS